MYWNLAPGLVGLTFPTLQDLAAAAARHGCGGIELPASALASKTSADEAARILADHRLQWGLLPLGADFLADTTDFDAALAELRRRAPLAARAGCTRCYNHVWPGSHTRTFQENWTWHLERLQAMHAVLEPHGITLGLEFIGPKTLRDTFAHPFIHTLEATLELADAVNPRLGVVLDLFHWYTSGGTMEDLEHLDTRRLVNVHLNDARADRTRDQQRDLERALPGTTGIIDAAAVLRTLHARGYNGPAVIEPFQPAKTELAALPPDTALTQLATLLKPLWPTPTFTGNT